MVSPAKNANLLLMFLLELGVLASVGYWGFTTGQNWPVKLLLGLGGVALFVAVWAVFGAADDARIPLTGLARVALELLWFGGGAAALALAGRLTPAIAFAAVYTVNAVLRLVWNQ
ncbi:YrdB family protein [Planomonospora sp. ID67723]|uniref:YrdB family protein n=1 Tax=Planomonospora sp. ID67723 TaxID=2738134 RepID=UPI0018C38167|nr:YrdB family protein [Planomonospora sp. ID67723]MBG0828964.1 YrdB family protein [Planomonospora sp. ID67723]